MLKELTESWAKIYRPINHIDNDPKGKGRGFFVSHGESDVLDLISSFPHDKDAVVVFDDEINGRVRNAMLINSHCIYFYARTSGTGRADMAQAAERARTVAVTHAMRFLKFMRALKKGETIGGVSVPKESLRNITFDDNSVSTIGPVLNDWWIAQIYIEEKKIFAGCDDIDPLLYNA